MFQIARVSWLELIFIRRVPNEDARLFTQTCQSGANGPHHISFFSPFLLFFFSFFELKVMENGLIKWGGGMDSKSIPLFALILREQESEVQRPQKKWGGGLMTRVYLKHWLSLSEALINQVKVYYCHNHDSSVFSFSTCDIHSFETLQQ